MNLNQVMINCHDYQLVLWYQLVSLVLWRLLSFVAQPLSKYIGGQNYWLSIQLSVGLLVT